MSTDIFGITLLYNFNTFEQTFILHVLKDQLAFLFYVACDLSKSICSIAIIIIEKNSWFEVYVVT